MSHESTLESISQKTPVRPNFPGILAGIWKLTWKSQLTWKKIYGVLSNILVLPVLSYFSFSFGDDSDALLRFLIDFYMLMVLPIICLTAFGGMVRDELQEDTVCFLLTRPMKRWQFFLSKYLSHLAWTQIIGALTLLAFAVAGTLRGVDDTPMLVLNALKVQFPAIMAYGAISSLLGLATKKYLVLGLVYGFVVEFGIGQIPTNINTLAMTNHLKSLMARYQPLADHLGYEPGRMLTALAALVVTTGVFLIFSSVLFTFREYNHSDEMSK
jgi:ABC-type transport system involved in multi-copper enzyme maturation permease subunit